MRASKVAEDTSYRIDYYQQIGMGVIESGFKGDILYIPSYLFNRIGLDLMSGAEKYSKRKCCFPEYGIQLLKMKDFLVFPHLEWWGDLFILNGKPIPESEWLKYEEKLLA